MAIQFSCVSCGKAIEIDVQWAHRLVECPYCHDTIRAPGMSTLNAEEIPVAAPVAGTFVPESANAAREAGPAGRPRGNGLAIAALVLSCAALVLLLWAGTHAAGVIESRLGSEATVADAQRLMQEAMENQEPWVVKLGFTFLGAFGMWVAGLACALVAMARPGRKGVAIAALIAGGVPLAMVVISLAATG